MKITGFNGSPRKNGNTAWLISKILEEAQKYGAETEIWHSGDLTINPCRSCNACKKGDEHCIINDDMQKLYASISTADALVLGSPVYMGQMSGQTKIFVDRLYAEFHPRFAPDFKDKNAGKKLALVFTQGNPDRTLFKPYYDYTKAMFQKLEFNVIDLLIAAGTRSTPASEDRELLSLAQGVGRSLGTGLQAVTQHL